MIDTIIQEFARKIWALGYISRVGGLAHDMKVPTGSQPVALLAPFDGEQVQYMAPDDAETGVCWFEASATNVVASTAHVSHMKNEVLLTVWLNPRRITFDSLIPAEMSAVAAIRDIRWKVQEGDQVRAVTVQYQGTAQTGANSFSRWSFDEEVNQLTLPPYRAAVHRFIVAYSVAKGCIPQVATTRQQC